MQVKVNINGIEQEIDTKNIQINNLTLDKMLNRLIKLEKEVKIMDERYRKRELRLITTWKKLRGNK